MNHSTALPTSTTSRAIALLFLGAALIMPALLASCGTEPAAPRWGVGASLVFDAYSLDESGFWKSLPDSTVTYRLVAVDGRVDGRTNVHVYVAGLDTIYLAGTQGGDFEVLYPQMAFGPMSLPRTWVPLPVATQRDTTFLVIDTTIDVFGNQVRMTGDTRSDYAGTENITIASGRLFSTARTDIIGDISGNLGPAPVDVDIRGSTYIAPGEVIVVRSDNQAQIGLPIGEPMRIGTSLRLKEANYPI